MQTGMQAVRAIHAETCIDTYTSGRQLQSDRQADTDSQTYMHPYTLRYRQIEAESAYTCSYMQKLTDRQRHTETDRDRQRQTETDRYRHRHT